MNKFRVALASMVILFSAATASEAQLNFIPSSLNFNEVMLSEIAVKTVHLTSQVVQTVVITGQSPTFSTVTDTLRFTSIGQSLPLGVRFHPLALGIASSSLTATGSVWGAATISVTGRAVLVSIGVSPNALEFGDVPLGQVSTLNISLNNTGTGTLRVFGATSGNPRFTVAPDTILVAEGASAVLPVSFLPTNNGLHETTVTFRTNAPYSPEITTFCRGTGSSEISGDVTGVWSLANSPYYIVGNVHVPENQTLTIEPGVSVVFSGPRDLSVSGTLEAHGLAGQAITFRGIQGYGALKTTSPNARLSLKYCEVDSLGVSAFSDGFESGVSARWSGDGDLSTDSPHAGAKCLELNALGQDKEAILGPFVAAGNMTVYYYWRSPISDGNCYFRVDYRKNGGSWINVQNYYYTTGWTSGASNLTCAADDIIEIRFQADIYGGDPSYNEKIVFLDDVSVNFNNPFTHAIEMAGGSGIFDHCSISNNVGRAIYATGVDTIMISDCELANNGQGGVYGTNVGYFKASGCNIHHNGGDGAYLNQVRSPIVIQHSTIHHNTGSGLIAAGAATESIVSNTICYRNTIGMQFSSNSSLDHVTFLNNSSYGVYTADSSFNQIYSSIIWLNNRNGTQLGGSGFCDIAFSNIQGTINGGSLGTNPLFASEDGVLKPYSPSIDKAAPWEHDANMPPGLGTIRADIGAYGGPGNDFWGGTPVPDGRPAIADIRDLPQDDGHLVGIQFQASAFDDGHAAYDIVSYSIWRDMKLGAKASMPSSPYPVGQVMNLGKSGYWEHVGDMVAQGFSGYGYSAPTLADSVAAGIPWNTFLVVAHTLEAEIFFVSEPDSGYSVDNLTPISPKGLVVNYGASENNLNWIENSEFDVAFYNVYRTEEGAFAPLPGALFASTERPAYVDGGFSEGESAWDFQYLITAVDDAGNESLPTVWSQSGVTGVGGSGVPKQFALYDSYPNPFNPRTKIRFDVPREAAVDLKVYDVAGRLVVSLIDGELFSAGEHEAVWTGVDSRGCGVAAGVYFYSIYAGDFRETRTMVLVK